MRSFDLILHKTYYEKGFFNVPVASDRYVRPTDGPIEVVLGISGIRIECRVDRKANSNKTPRILGGAQLRDWFQEHCVQGDIVRVDLIALASIHLSGGTEAEIQSKSLTLPNPDPVEIGVNELSDWRRRIARLLSKLYPGPEESVGTRINHLSRSGRIPREVAALMRVVTEMRNATEYHGKRLSQSESIAVKKAMDAILEWAEANSLAI